MITDYSKEILTIDNNEIELSDRSEEIDLKTEQKESQRIVKELKATIRKNDIVALAAPQIGEKRRIFCIQFDTEIKTLINPMLVDADGLQLVKEKSVVAPGKVFLRPRSSKVKVIYQRPTGQTEQREFLGLAAIYVQECMDALDGILETDIALEIDEDFENASEEEKEQIVQMYLESLDIKMNNLNKEIDSDKELSQMRDAIKYMTSIQTGETKLE